MRNVSSKKGWMSGTTQPHIKPLTIPLIKENHDGKSDKDFVKLKLCKDPTSSTLDLYEFKMSLFYNVEPGEFLLFVSDADAKFQCLLTLVRGEALRQFDLFSADIEST